MVISLPFFLIYLYSNKKLHRKAMDFGIGVIISSFLLIVPFLLNQDGVNMLIASPEMFAVLQLKAKISDNVVVFIVPLIYVMMLCALWRMRRLNFDLFNSMMGLAFLLIVLLTPNAPVGLFG